MSMTGLTVFWSVLAMAALAFAVITRVYPLSFAAFGFALSAVLAWRGDEVWMQAGLSAVLLSLAVFLWVRRTQTHPVPERDSAHSRLTGMPNLSQFSVFSDETDEVNIERWRDDGTTEIVFRGRPWRARLARGARAHAGVYRVREVRDGVLVLDEMID